MNTKVKNLLKPHIDKEYQKFSAGLLPETNNILGVRLPILRKFAKDFVRNNEYEKILGENFDFFEGTMLQAMIIGYLKTDIKTHLKLVADFVPKIDNWSVCDSFCIGLKFVKTNKETVFKFLDKYLRSTKEFEARFALVILLNYFIEDNYIDKIFEILPTIKPEKRYTIMAQGWLISYCYKKFPQKTTDFLNKNSLSEKVTKIARQKIRELK